MVAEFFDLGEGGVEGFGAFFEDAEGFGEAFAGGDDEGGEGVAAEFGVGFDGGADVVAGISEEDDITEGGGGEEFGEGVAEVLEVGGDGGIVEREAGVVFHHAEGFARAVGVGVNHAENGGVWCGIHAWVIPHVLGAR